MGMTWLRAMIVALTAEQMDGKTGVALATVVALVPFGWLILLVRWAPIRRALRNIPEEA
jgi:hypothetical protein